ncbi:MAG: cupin domain-containing protein [Longimicrobiaceae bacterium]
MTALERPLQGDVLRFRLGKEHLMNHDQEILERSGRSARTLVKNGPLRVTLITLAPGGDIAEHRAEGPITVHILHGTIEFRVGGETHALSQAELLALGGGVPHSVRSDTGGAFLLTVVQSNRSQGPDGPTEAGSDHD